MPGKRTPLSRELITNTAVDVVRREGLAALSMRRLAQELDVWPMSMYRHFRDKEELLDAVAAAGAEDVELPSVRGQLDVLGAMRLRPRRVRCSSASRATCAGGR